MSDSKSAYSPFTNDFIELERVSSYEDLLDFTDKERILKSNYELTFGIIESLPQEILSDKDVAVKIMSLLSNHDKENCISPFQFFSDEIRSDENIIGALLREKHGILPYINNEDYFTKEKLLEIHAYDPDQLPLHQTATRIQKLIDTDEDIALAVLSGKPSAKCTLLENWDFCKRAITQNEEVLANLDRDLYSNNLLNIEFLLNEQPKIFNCLQFSLHHIDVVEKGLTSYMATTQEFPSIEGIQRIEQTSLDHQRLFDTMMNHPNLENLVDQDHRLGHVFYHFNETVSRDIDNLARVLEVEQPSPYDNFNYPYFLGNGTDKESKNNIDRFVSLYHDFKKIGLSMHQETHQFLSDNFLECAETALKRILLASKLASSLDEKPQPNGKADRLLEQVSEQADLPKPEKTKRLKI